MRKNTAAVLEALTKKKAKHSCDAIHTDGHVVFSYATVVAVPDVNKAQHWFVTEHGAHTLTTTVQTNGLEMGLRKNDCEVSRVSQEEVDEAYFRFRNGMD